MRIQGLLPTLGRAIIATTLLSLSTAHAYQDIPYEGVRAVFDKYYSLDTNVAKAWFEVTTFPLTRTPDTQGAFVYLQGNQGEGAIYWFSNEPSITNGYQSTAAALWGPVLQRWKEAGFENGFGYPVQDVQVVAPIQVNVPGLGSRMLEGAEFGWFTRLYGIFSSASGGVRVVEGHFLQEWASIGYQRVGWPIGDEYQQASSCQRRQDFTFAYLCYENFSYYWYGYNGRRL